MSDNQPPKSFDLAAALKPPRAVLPGIGEVSVRIRTVSFLRWFGEGERRSRWHDGPEFIRALLQDRIGPFESIEGEQESSIDPAVIDAVNDDQLESIAEQILIAATPVFRSLQGQADKAGTTTPQPANQPLVEEQRPSERLLSGARAYNLDFTTGQKRMTDRLNDTLGLASVMREAKLLRETSSLRRSIDPFNLGIMSRMDKIARGELFAIDGIANGAVGRLIAGDRYLDTVGSLSKALGLAEMGQARWTSASKLLGLGLSESILAATSGLGTSLATQFQREAAGLFRPGYQSIASLALDGSIARGAASDLLRDYDTMGHDGPIFRSILEAITVLDDEEALAADRLATLEKIISLFGTVVDWGKSEIDKAGWVAILGVVLSVLAAFPDLSPWHHETMPTKQITEATVAIKTLTTDIRASKREADHKHIRYLCGRANLRRTPERGGLLLRIVYPDQLVEVRDTRGDWARVSVYDYTSDTPVEGWMSRRNLYAAPG